MKIYNSMYLANEKGLIIFLLLLAKRGIWLMTILEMR
jgi:hypothetical protein